MKKRPITLLLLLGLMGLTLAACAQPTPLPNGTASPPPTVTTSPTQPNVLATQAAYYLALPTFTPVVYFTETPLPTAARPTETPAPTPTFVPMADYLPPLTTIQAGPHLVASVPPSPTVAGDFPEPLFTRAYVQAATDALNLAQGDERAFIGHIAAWLPETQGQDPGKVWVRATDLDGDGSLEYLVSVPFRRENFKGQSANPGKQVARRAPTGEFIACGFDFCLRLVILFQRHNGLFVPISVVDTRWLGADTPGWMSHPQIFAIEDLNNDGQVELVIRTDSYGNHGMVDTQLLLFNWDEKGWHYRSSVADYNQVFLLADIDFDHHPELITWGGTVGVTWINPQRPTWQIYEWQNGSYPLIPSRSVPATDPQGYFLMLDANVALRRRQWTEANALAQLALKPAQPCNYAAVEVALAQTALGDPTWLAERAALAQTQCALTDTYGVAVQLLWQAYQQTHDLPTACRAMETYVLAHWQPIIPIEINGPYPGEGFDNTTVCPLDNPLAPLAASIPAHFATQSNSYYQTGGVAFSVGSRIFTQASGEVATDHTAWTVDGTVTGLSWLDATHLAYTIRLSPTQTASIVGVLNSRTGEHWPLYASPQLLLAPTYTPDSNTLTFFENALVEQGCLTPCQSVSLLLDTGFHLK